MPNDRRDPRDFGWLYGEGNDDPGAPEPTRVIPTRPRPETHPKLAPEPPRRSRPVAPVEHFEDDPHEPDIEPSRPRKSRLRRIWFWTKVAVVLFLIYLIAVPMWAYGRIDRFNADPQGDRPADQPGTTYLLVGSDSREGLTAKQRKQLGTGNAAGRRTDTMMLLHTGSGQATLISIPRDSLVPIPGHGTSKINAAYAWGGPKLLVQTVESNTGVRVDHVVEIGFGGFVKAVDAVGGIRVCTKTRLEDPLANLHLSKGCHDIDGAVALGYARSRHTQADGDLGRARHQREVVQKVGEKVKSPASVLLPWRYYGLADAGSTSLRVSKDAGPFTLANFALAMTNARSCAMPISDMVIHWDQRRAKQLMSIVAEDRTDDITKQLCTPNGLPLR